MIRVACRRVENLFKFSVHIEFCRLIGSYNRNPLHFGGRNRIIERLRKIIPVQSQISV